MTVTLTVDERAWRAHVADFVALTAGLVPVVKGNGYGFGRSFLATEACAFAETIAVGTVHELAGVEAPTVLVLTPATSVPRGLRSDGVVLTVGAPWHVDVLSRAHWRGRVAVKLASSMRRYGAEADEVGALVAGVERAGLTVDSFVLHLPLPGDGYDSCAAVQEVEEWEARLDPGVPLSVGHVDPASYEELRAHHPDREWQLRAGTALWHGDKSFLHLTADVVDTRRVAAGSRAGYRRVPIDADGTLVMIGAGTSCGLTVPADGRSPFHHARRRLGLIEPPHMHTSIAFVPAGEPCPAPGDPVDVQRPLTTIDADEIVWT